MKGRPYVIAFLLGAATLAVVGILYATHTNSLAWQRHAEPGELSAAHAFLESDCEACHSAVEGPTDAKCIGCHANATALIQRQPTAFHADIGECSQCHVEHRGTKANLREMNHVALARIGLRELENAQRGNPSKHSELMQWVDAHPGGSRSTPSHPHIQPTEMTLDCRACHATKDRHVGLFGSDCASCHATAQWTIAEFRHPSPDSFECAQCHQAPPSHYMMHFNMVSKRVARQEDAQVAACCGPAQVNQCYRCHQTTSWNDIKGVGWYKHH